MAVGRCMRLIPRICAAVGLAFVSSLAPADEVQQMLDEGGYRPYASRATAFVESLDTATIVVYPTMVRRETRTAASFRSQAEIIEQLNAAGINAVRGGRRIDLGPLFGTSQWDIFQTDMAKVAEAVSGRQPQAQYHLVLEFLLPVTDEWIFGIECYVLDRDGTNAMSFLLNSYHRIFREAGLQTKDESEEARLAMESRATAIAVQALLANIERERGKASRLAAFAAAEHETVVFDDFETPVATTADYEGIPVGFVTFTDGVSTVAFSTTAEYSPLPDAAADNRVLRLDFDVQNWAAFAHFFFYEGHEATIWIPYDWRAWDGISFRLYGRGSGAGLFVDVIDNRNPHLPGDTAERYVYDLADDFEGWRTIEIPFGAFMRKDSGPHAPNDGLGLDAVHGWAIGATVTDGPATWYVDDFALVRTVPGTRSAPAADAWPINERPMYGLAEKTPEQKRADEEYIRMMTEGGRSREDAAEVAAKNAWYVFYSGDKVMAIRRFNQAWLLDPDNALALWGFAVTSIDRGDWEAALRYYRMAMENDPDNPRLQLDYELALRQVEKVPVP